MLIHLSIDFLIKKRFILFVYLVIFSCFISVFSAPSPWRFCFPCLLVCDQDYTKTTEQISTKLGRRTGLGSEQSPLSFALDLNKETEPIHFVLSFFNIGIKSPVCRQLLSMSEHRRRLMVLGEGLLVYFCIFTSSCIFIFAPPLSFKAKRGTVGRDEAETVSGSWR